MVEVEPFDGLFAADDLVVAMTPAEPEEVIADRFGQIAELVAVGIDPERAVALAELGAVGPVDQRHVGVGRLGPAHRLDDRQLAEGVVEMVVAADDVGDAHVVIVDHDCEHIGRRAVRAQQDEVVELGVLHGHAALDLVVDDRLALAWRLEADDQRRLRLRRCAHATGCRCGTGGARPAPFRAGPRALPGSSSSDRLARAPASGARPRRGAPRIATDNIRVRPNRGRANAFRRGSPRSPVSVERALSVSSMRSRNLPP